MMKNILDKYAELLVKYCLELKAGDRLYVRTTTAAEPLLIPLYQQVLEAGAVMDVQFRFREQYRLLMNHGNEFQVTHINPLYETAVQDYDAFLSIMAPFNLREDQNANTESAKIRGKSMKALTELYFQRTGSRDLRRSLCLFPTQASAQKAGMSLAEYEQFVYQACKLYDDNPIESWKALGRQQQKIVDFLNQREEFHYLGDNIDIRFSTKGRTWINSDGKNNMPSGEVYTSPVENGVNGHIHFSFPGYHMGNEVEGVTLYVKDGWIERWEATRGKAFLDKIFAMEGTRRFGEAAIGTNYGIDRLTGNILFDEKIGGTVHMAIGQSYHQAGGKNSSSVHWDMITDMTKEGAIFADGEKIYEKGRFLPEIMNT